ncbi:MAG TPA: hypothetical protein VM223_17755 [Planctomycetota bacterium]|nr:hypothetical protein [Planctomycetota bacterium]
MKSRQILMVFSVAATIGAAAYVATIAQTAEKGRTEEQPYLAAAMQVDIGPLLKKMDALQAEIAQLRATADALNEKTQAMQDSLDKVEKAIGTLERPAKWQYHFLYQNSLNAANKLGEDGWELITSGKDNLLIFRKPAGAKED